MFANHELSKPSYENLRSLNHRLIKYLNDIYPIFHCFDPKAALEKETWAASPIGQPNIDSSKTEWNPILVGTELYSKAYSAASAGPALIDSQSARHEDFINGIISVILVADHLIEQGRPTGFTDRLEYSELMPDLIDKIEILQTAEYTIYHNLPEEFKPCKIFRLRRAGQLVAFGSNIVKMREELHMSGFSRFHGLLEKSIKINLYAPE